MNCLENKEKMLFLPTEQDYKKSANEWGQYLINAKKLDKDHYYGITTQSFTDAIDWGRIVSYNEAMKVLDAID